MKRTVNVHDAKTHFSRLLEAVEAGEEIVVSANFLIDAESNLTSALQGLMADGADAIPPAEARDASPTADQDHAGHATPEQAPRDDPHADHGKEH